MLLAVEGGRFFSSSASGYSNGLNLLLLGHKKEEKPMRVSPWNQYHLVDHQESDPDPQLAANNVNKRCACGCACFGRTSNAGLEIPSTHQQHKNAASDLEKVKEIPPPPPTSDFVDNSSLKSSLKRRVNTDDDGVEIDTRNVQWTDVVGGELVQIREFEPSEHSDSDDDFEHSSGKTCSCRIM